MNLKLPIGRDAIKSLRNWASEMRGKDFVTRDDFTASDWFEIEVSAKPTLDIDSQEPRYGRYFTANNGEIVFFKADFTLNIGSPDSDRVIYLKLPVPTNFDGRQLINAQKVLTVDWGEPYRNLQAMTGHNGYDVAGSEYAIIHDEGGSWTSSPVIFIVSGWYFTR